MNRGAKIRSAVLVQQQDEDNRIAVEVVGALTVGQTCAAQASCEPKRPAHEHAIE